jgi:small subunit ribosomal protein S6
MRNYEVAVIVNPDLDDQAIQSLEEKLKGWISAAEGQTVDIERWGRRRLAYAIEGNRDGYYFFVNSQMPPQGTASLERELKLNEEVMRFMITLKDEA